MFLGAELVMLHDVCQPANSFRGLCGLSEQTESSATPSDGSLFWVTLRHRSSWAFTSFNLKGLTKVSHTFSLLYFFYPLLSLPSFLVFSSCQRLLCSSRLLSFLFSVLLALAGGSSAAESSFQSWEGPKLCEGCRGHYSLLLPPLTPWSNAEVWLLNHTAARAASFTNYVSGKAGSELFV